MSETKDKKEVLLSLKNVQVSFGESRRKFIAVNHINFDIYKGETFALVGESGSGKTTIGRAIVRLNETSEGSIFFKGNLFTFQYGEIKRLAARSSTV